MLGLQICPLLFELIQHGSLLFERRELIVLPFYSLHDHREGFLSPVELFFSRFLLLQFRMVLGNLLPLLVYDFLLVSLAHDSRHIELALEGAKIILTLLASFSHLHHVPVHVHELSFACLLYGGKVVRQLSGSLLSGLII